MERKIEAYHCIHVREQMVSRKTVIFQHLEARRDARQVGLLHSTCYEKKKLQTHVIKIGLILNNKYKCTKSVSN